MKQSTVIFGALIFGFVIFVTVRGDLASWLALFHVQGPKTTTASPPPPPKPSGLLATIGTIANVAKTAAMFA